MDAAIVSKVMAAISDEFSPCEELATAAVGSEEALLKLEFIWQNNPHLEVTNAMIEAAARSTSVEVLDFLITRCSQFQVTEDLVRIALLGPPPNRHGPPPYSYEAYTQRDRKRDMISCLMAQATKLDLSQSTVELVIRNTESSVAQAFIACRQNNDLGKEVIIAMLDSEWAAESIYYSIGKITNRSALLGDLDVLSKAVSTKEGQAFLRLAKPDDRHIFHLMSEKAFAEAALNSKSSDWALLDQMHRANEVYLNDGEIAHLWGEVRDNTRQVLYHILEQGVHGRMGWGTFETFSSSCISDSRIIGRLPECPIDVDSKLIESAKTAPFGRVSLDAILGPDYDAVIHETALVAAARLGEELWFQRLLALAEKQSLVITDKGTLMDAARVGAVDSTIGTCRMLREGVSVSFLPCCSIRQ
ncbi:MAG: hypothetical protein LQ342_007660 [Letrouitia transgressa]|nr:MAG: hypothetical protein LQ342_007660 [Letrouitia transgressa]